MQPPEFKNDKLLSLSVFCTLKDKVKAMELSESGIEGDSQYGDGYWLHMLANRRQSDFSEDEADCFHFQLDAVKRFESFKSEATDPLDTLMKKIDGFSGLEGPCWVLGRFLIPQDDLPEHGIVKSFSGLATESCGMEFMLNGARFKINDEVFDELNWTIKDDGMALIVLDAFMQTKIDDDLFARAYDLIWAGIESVILDKHQVENDDVSTKTKAN